VEYFSTLSPERTEYFFLKLQELLSKNRTVKFLKQREGSRLNRRKFTVAFLNNISKIQTKSQGYHEIVKIAEEGLGRAMELINEDLKRQDEQFHNKLKQKQLRKTRYKKKKVTMSLDEIVNEYIKKFHVLYFSRVANKPMQISTNAYKEMYNEKVRISKEFDSQIKEFELLFQFEDSKCYLYN
jgi:hypothetical protein